MRLRTTILAALAALSLAGGAARAQDAVTTDIRCTLVGFMMSNSDDPAIKSSSLLVSFYFLGRIDSRQPPVDLEARIVEEVGKMSAEDLQAQALVCASMLTARGTSLTAMGQRLQNLKLPEPKKPAS